MSYQVIFVLNLVFFMSMFTSLLSCKTFVPTVPYITYFDAFSEPSATFSTSFETGRELAVETEDEVRELFSSHAGFRLLENLYVGVNGYTSGLALDVKYTVLQKRDKAISPYIQVSYISSEYEIEIPVDSIAMAEESREVNGVSLKGACILSARLRWERSKREIAMSVTPSFAWSVIGKQSFIEPILSMNIGFSASPMRFAVGWAHAVLRGGASKIVTPVGIQMRIEFE